MIVKAAPGNFGEPSSHALVDVGCRIVVEEDEAHDTLLVQADNLRWMAHRFSLLARTREPGVRSCVHVFVCRKILQNPRAFRMLNHNPRPTTREPVRSQDQAFAPRGELR
jgi:hypothetical protein